MTTAFVTGGSGFIGAHVVRALVREGVAVRALVRAGDPANLRGLDVEPVRGDVRDPASIEAAMRGADVVFHVAARYSLRQRDRDEVWAVNVDGTRTVMETALRAGVARVVHTSSVAAVGHAVGDRLANESDWADPERVAGPYEASKYASERLVQRMVAQRGLPAVVVNPTAPIGPRDLRPTPTGRMVLDAARGSMPAYLASAGLNVAPVEDVARGHLLAWRRGQVGRRYILGHADGNLSLREILQRAAAAAGRAGPRWAMPYAAARAYAELDERVLSRLRGGDVRAPIAGVRLARERMWFDCGRAITELGMPQSPLAAAFEEAVADFAARGLLDRDAGGRAGFDAARGRP